MKGSLFPLLTLALTAFITTAPPDSVRATDYEAPGNLQSTAPLGCVALASVTNRATPADIYPGVAQCVRAGEYDRAVSLFLLAGVYGRFDMLRVSDTTAYQAIQVLEINNLGNLPNDQQAAFKQAGLLSSKQGSHKLAALCASIERIGAPNYFPTYMIQHGMGAFIGKQGNGLRTNFDPKKSWHEALSNYLRCP